MTYILLEVNTSCRDTTPCGPLTRSAYSKHTSTMTLELAHFTREAMPGYTMQLLSTHITVGGPGMGASKPAVLALQVLNGLQNTLYM